MSLPNGPRRANHVFFMCRSDWGPLTHAHVRLKIASKVAAQTHDLAKCGGRVSVSTEFDYVQRPTVTTLRAKI